jgi:DNA-binding HxlR family transcriptional regulator
MVEYTLTTLGQSLHEPIESLAIWAKTNGEQVKNNRLKNDKT